MEKKSPITIREANKLLADFIVKNFPICPIDYTICVNECEGWGCDYCSICIRKKAEHLRNEDEVLKGV